MTQHDYICEVADYHFGLLDISLEALDLARSLGVEPQHVGEWWDAILAADAPIR